MKLASSPEFEHKVPQQKKIAVQVRNIHMLALILALTLITAITVIMVTRITASISEDIVRFYSIEAIGKFNSYVSQELVLARKAARSTAVIDWFADEGNPAKRATAYDEMTDYTAVLQDARLYFGIHESTNEYSIDNKTPFAQFIPFSKLDPTDSNNDWYFNCIKSGSDYTFNVDIDKMTQKKHVWINHKVMNGNNLVGVFCFGRLFDELAANLFVRYDDTNERGYIINKEGFIQIDSGDMSASYYEHKVRIHTLYHDPAFFATMESYLNNIDHYFDLSAQPITIKINSNAYKYASIAPIAGTDWSVVTFFNNNSLYSITDFLPLLITMLLAFILYTVFSTFAINRLVITPLDRLKNSLSASNFYMSEIFGCNRDDEIGVLAQTVQRMRDRLSIYNAELLRDAREREYLIRIDQLTNIPNRRSFDERMPLEWGRAMRTKTFISLLILDLDYFKTYNDTYGHLQGDKALQIIAKLFVQELKRSGDLVARWGGEEFAILLSNTDFNGAMEIAERIRLKIEDVPVPLPDGSISRITVSIGINSLIPATNDTLEDFVRHADMALYTAKREGRNRVFLYNGIHL
jgi:diguanylate cyclase (GGDEF)-like protein